MRANLLGLAGVYFFFVGLRSDSAATQALSGLELKWDIAQFINYATNSMHGLMIALLLFAFSLYAALDKRIGALESSAPPREAAPEPRWRKAFNIAGNALMIAAVVVLWFAAAPT